MKKFLYAAVFGLAVACNDSDNTQSTTSITAPDAPKSIGYSILNTYHHDTSSFTQGLAIYKSRFV